jgi:hypothetical protein
VIKKILISSSALAVFIGVSLGSTATAKGPTSLAGIETSSADAGPGLTDSSDLETMDVNELFEIGSSFNSFRSSNRVRTRYRYKADPSSSSLDSGSSSDFNSDAYTRSLKASSSSSSTSNVYTSSGPNTSLPNADLPNADPNWH